MTRFWPFSLPLLTLACFFPPAIAQTIIPAQDGTATLVMPNGNTFNISGGTLSGDGRNLFHSFQEFGLSAQQIANFLANPQIQNILGRVTGGNPSIINGLIQVTGGNPNLFLMNPSGIVFGPNASLNVPANFAATTSTAIGFSGGQFNAYGVNNYQALVGNPNSFVFQGVTPGAIINAGNLAVNAGQDISLIGGTVINTGKISAPGGEITLSAVPGSSLVRISQTGQILSLEVPVPQDVQGNALPFKPTDLPTLLTTSGVNTGLTVTPTGTVAIAATGTPIPTSAGTNILSGQVSTANAQGLGGKIQATGTQVGLVNATLNASGQTGGGTVLIGGDYQGKGTLPNAQNTYVSQDSVIQANALTQGNGGKVIVWADGNTQFLGSIEAKGGGNGGDGGFAEVSGKQNLGFQGNVNLSATQGKLGNLLLDPENITIIDSTGAVNDSSLPNIPFDQDPGVNYTISNSALQALAGDTNIQLEAANNITIDPLTSTGGFLSFQPGTGTITFIANADNAGGGDFSMDTTNTISTAGRSLTIKGNNITVGGIQSSFSTVGGDVILQATSNLQANGLISTGGGSFTASGNDVAINNTVNTSSFTGTGGNVDLTGTNITVTPSSSAFSPAIQTGGGNVNATATGNLTINPSAITGIGTIDTSNFSAGTGGTVTLNTGGTNQIAGQVSTGGGNFTASGNDVVINNAVNTSNFSTGATGGGVNLTGTNITVTPSSTAFSSAIQTGGGSVNATATNNLTINPSITGSNAIDTSNFSSGTGGAVTLSAGATNQIGGSISTGGGSFTASGNNLAINNSVNTSNFSTGTGGNVDLTGTNITVTPSSTAFSSSIQTGGGIVNATATNNLTINPSITGSNAIDTSNFSSGTGGAVTLSAGATNQIGGSISTGGGSFTASGNDLTINNAVNVITSNFSAGTTGGAVTLNAGGTNQIGGYISTGGGNFTATGGNITVTNSISTNSFSAGTGGAVTLNADGTNQIGGYVSTGGGNFTATGGDVAITSYVDTSNYSSSVTTGGTVTLSASGTNQIGGSIYTGGGSFTATATNIKTTNQINTENFSTGMGGSVNLQATDTIQVGDYTINPGSITTSGSIYTGGGSFTATGANITTASPIFTTNYAGGIGGNINLQATGTIQVQEVATGGGSFNARANNIVSLSNYFSINTGSYSTGIKGGDVNLQSTGNIQLTGNQSFGTIQTSGGNFTANGTNLNIAEVNTSTGSDGVDGGAISLTATGNIQTGNLFSYTTANRSDGFSRGGDISLNAGGTIDTTTGKGITIVQDATSSLQVPAIASGSSTGNGGNVSLVAGGNIKAPFIGTGSLSSGTAGSINITSQNGAIDATQTLSWNGETQIFGGLVSASVYGNGGNITLSAPGDIQTGVIATGNIGGPVTPGNVNITSQNGSINTAIGANIDTVSAEFLASLGVPDQYLAEASQIQVGLGIFTFSKDTGGGNVTLQAKGDITTSNIITGSLNGNGGNITLNSQEGAINTSSGILFQGLNATTLEQIGASANLAKLGAYLSDNKIGGLITFSVYGRGGDISLTAPQGITTNYLVSSSYTQQGGNISLNSTNGGIKISGLLTNPLNPLTFDNASDTLSLSDWNAIGWLFSQGSLSTRGGTNGGNITLLANGDIEVVTVNAQGGDQGQGGVVEIRTPQSLRVTGTFSDRNNTLSSISTAASAGRGGNITIQVGNYPFIVGDASRNGTTGAITSGDFTISSGEFSFTTQVGNIQLLLQNPPVDPPVNPPIDPPIDPPIETLIPPNKTNLSSSLNAVLQTPPPDTLPPLALTTTGLTISTVPQVQDVLAQIAEATGKKPALVYVNFISPNLTNPEFDNQQFKQRELALASEYQTLITPTLAQIPPTLAVPPRANYVLQLTVLIPGQEPYQVVVPEASRDKILAKARPLQRQLANQQDNYLDNASQLYQWLIAPIEQQLTTEKIDNVLFFLPSGLRTLPLSALYDRSTQQFAVEKTFTLGTAPSLNLVDYRYRNLNQAPVLAFGATDFPDQNQSPLPGVGIELPLIQSIKGGSYFLNQAFNLTNVETQRRENPLPIVHLATHAKFVAAAPRQSYIQLFDQRLVLPSWQDLALNLPKTDLLVISACESAVGNEDVELGFGGMAVQAGVKTAVASLWPVGDIGTVGLMDGFYRSLKVTSTKAEALQQVQRAMLKGNYRWSGNQLITPENTIDFPGSLPQNMDLRHPYYWSSFMMIGSPW